MKKRPAKPTAADKSETGPESLSFEQAVERLEEIIDRIESGEVGLEQSLTEFEEGMGLLKRCRAILAIAEQKVSELAPNSDDAPATRGIRKRAEGASRADS